MAVDIKAWLQRSTIHAVHHIEIMKCIELYEKQVAIEKSKKAAEGKWLVKKMVEFYGEGIRKSHKNRHVVKRLDSFLSN